MKGFVASVGVLLSGTALAQVIGVLSVPVIALLYAPAEFGIFTVVWVVVATVGNLLTLRYERFIVIADTNDQADCAFWLAIGTGALLLLLIAVFGAALSTLSIEFPIRVLSGALDLAIFMLLILLVALSQVLIQWLIRQRKFFVIAKSEVISAACVLAFQVVLAFSINPTASSLLLGLMAGRCAQVLYLLSHCRPNPSQISFLPIWKMAVDQRHFPLFATPYGFISTSVSRALILVSAAFMPAEVVGKIALAYRLTYLPASMLSNSLRRVYITRLSRQIGCELFRAKSMVLSLCISTLIIPYAFGVIFILPIVIDRFLSSSWQGVEQFSQYLLIGAGPLLITGWFDRVYEVLGKQKIAFMLELVSSCIIICLFWLTLKFGMIIDHAIVVFGLCVGLYNIVWLMYSWNLANFPIRRFRTAALLTGVSVPLICFSAALLERYDLPLSLQTISIATLVAFSFILLVYLIRLYPGRILVRSFF